MAGAMFDQPQVRPTMDSQGSDLDDFPPRTLATATTLEVRKDPPDRVGTPKSALRPKLEPDKRTIVPSLENPCSGDTAVGQASRTVPTINILQRDPPQTHPSYAAASAVVHVVSLRPRHARRNFWDKPAGLNSRPFTLRQPPAQPGWEQTGRGGCGAWDEYQHGISLPTQALQTICGGSLYRRTRDRMASKSKFAEPDADCTGIGSKLLRRFPHGPRHKTKYCNGWG